MRRAVRRTDFVSFFRRCPPPIPFVLPRAMRLSMLGCAVPSRVLCVVGVLVGVAVLSVHPVKTHQHTCHDIHGHGGIHPVMREAR